MNASDLTQFLSGELPGFDLQSKICSEVKLCVNRQKERGRSAIIELLGMTDTYKVTPSSAARLLDALISGELTDESFHYILNALLLEDKFLWTSISIREAMEGVLSEGGSALLVDMRIAWIVRDELRQKIKATTHR